MHTSRFFSLFLAAWLAGGLASVRATDPPVRELRIAPATTSVPLGRAKLSVEPLVRAAGKNSGDGLEAAYKVEVSPLSIAGEEGSLTIAISEESLRRLGEGQPIDFTGQAVSTGGNNSAVRGTATPTGGGRDTGAIRVHIESKKGKLVFKTTYHLVR